MRARDFASRVKTEQFLVNLMNGSITIDQNEQNIVIGRLRANAYDHMDTQLWQILYHAIPDAEAIKLAMSLLDHYRHSPDATIHAVALPEVLGYLLRKSPLSKQCIMEFSNIGPVLLRRAVADYLVETGHVREGLWLMLDVLPNTGTDHASFDNITLTFNAIGTPAIKLELLAEAEKSELAGDLVRAESAKWLSSCIPD
ncbi:hypothetical protein IP91_01450 [Pseudoduganella lurida]|uniref:HEAT repeat domain-containing protein n=1 Tax=Pseudoduganella lurida TaxID=1036180 RepID=A0A562RE21_9BURK|nr:hypothetical protein [Pseudoduganella lurida]TWI67337.1 hypothetical protein IP91_01450 [Pseudoduganella lurida]